MTQFENSAWSGSASNWDTPQAYCSDCLIDLNTGSEKVKEKCKLPYRKPGSKAVNKNALKAMVGGRGITAVDAPSEAKRKAANWIIRKYMEAFGKPAPASVYQIAGKTPPKNKAIIFKDSNNQYWFLGIYSNNYQDKKEDILTWESHLEYAKWVMENGITVPITILHQPQFPEILHLAQLMALNMGKISVKEYNQNYRELYAPFAIAETKAIVPIKGFVFVIGKILKNKIDKIELLYKSGVVWGMSHGFFPIQMNEGIINKYRSFELSVLPQSLAANELTVASIKTEKQ